MTDPTRAAAILVRVAELLTELPAADLAALVEGRARLAVVPVDPAVAPAPRPSGVAPRRAAAAPPADLTDAVTALATMASREDGTTYLSPWSARDLRALAARLGLRGVTALRRADLIERLVDRTIGYRLASTAIRHL